MTNEQREHERINFINIIEKSWTWARLTNFERSRINENLTFCKLYGTNKTQVHEILNAIYKAFLDALNYEPIGWRDSKNEDIITF